MRTACAMCVYAVRALLWIARATVNGFAKCHARLSWGLKTRYMSVVHFDSAFLAYSNTIHTHTCGTRALSSSQFFLLLEFSSEDTGHTVWWRHYIEVLALCQPTVVSSIEFPFLTLIEESMAWTRHTTKYKPFSSTTYFGEYSSRFSCTTYESLFLRSILARLSAHTKKRYPHFAYICRVYWRPHPATAYSKMIHNRYVITAMQANMIGNMIIAATTTTTTCPRWIHKYQIWCERTTEEEEEEEEMLSYSLFSSASARR